MFSFGISYVNQILFDFRKEYQNYSIIQYFFDS